MPPGACTPGMARQGDTGLRHTSAMSTIASAPSTNSYSSPPCSFSQLCRWASIWELQMQLEADSVAAAVQHLGARAVGRKWDGPGWAGGGRVAREVAGQTGRACGIVATQQQCKACVSAHLRGGRPADSSAARAVAA